MALNPFQMIFGGQDTQSTSVSTPTNLNPFTQSLQGTVNTLGNSPLPTYNGPLTGQMSGNENTLLGNLMTQQSQGGGAAGTNDYLSSVLQGNFMPGSPNGNPFLSGAITAAQRTTMNNLTDTLSRALPGYFTANGQMISPNNKGSGGSSAFDTAAALATQGAANAMGDIASNVSNNAYNTGISQMQGAAGLSQQEISNTINNLQAQSLPRMITELGIERGMSLYQTNLNGVLNLLQTLGGIAKPVIGNTTTSTSTGNQTPGILPDLTNLFKPSGNGGQQS